MNIGEVVIAEDSVLSAVFLSVSGPIRPQS
jgi:hypothetical protein